MGNKGKYCNTLDYVGKYQDILGNYCKYGTQLAIFDIFGNYWKYWEI